MAKGKKKVAHRHKEGRALYFDRTVTIPPTKTTPAVEYEQGKWYDNVSPEHAKAAGDAALAMHRDHECGCWLLDDGREVVTKTHHVQDQDADGKAFMRAETRVTIQKHDCVELED